MAARYGPLVCIAGAAGEILGNPENDLEIVGEHPYLYVSLKKGTRNGKRLQFANWKDPPFLNG
jgi:hypothetical protein